MSSSSRCPTSVGWCVRECSVFWPEVAPWPSLPSAVSTDVPWDIIHRGDGENTSVTTRGGKAVDVMASSPESVPKGEEKLDRDESLDESRTRFASFRAQSFIRSSGKICNDRKPAGGPRNGRPAQAPTLSACRGGAPSAGRPEARGRKPASRQHGPPAQPRVSQGSPERLRCSLWSPRLRFGLGGQGREMVQPEAMPRSFVLVRDSKD